MLLWRFYLSSREHILIVVRCKIYRTPGILLKQSGLPMCCFFTLYRCVFALSVRRLHFTVKVRGKEKASRRSQCVTLMDTINLPAKLGKKYGWDGKRTLTLFIYENSFWGFKSNHTMPQNPPSLRQPETFSIHQLQRCQKSWEGTKGKEHPTSTRPDTGPWTEVISSWQHPCRTGNANSISTVGNLRLTRINSLKGHRARRQNAGSRPARWRFLKYYYTKFIGLSRV